MLMLLAALSGLVQVLLALVTEPPSPVPSLGPIQKSPVMPLQAEESLLVPAEGLPKLDSALSPMLELDPGLRVGRSDGTCKDAAGVL